MDDERAWRLASNEALFRLVNERVKGLARHRRDPKHERTGFTCECGRMGCVDSIYLTSSEYEAVRADPATFFVVPGHEMLKIERVVERYENYLVVEKTGHGRKAAIETDPRS
jgi:hypothetical protein